jgi:dihydroflavonol-4-reductase
LGSLINHKIKHLKKENIKILVTGGTGFIGAHIVHALLRSGYRHIFVSKRKSSPIHLLENILHRIELVDAALEDLTDLTSLVQKVDVIVHTAAMVSFLASDKKSMLKTNVEGTANLVNIALENKIEKFIHISSVAALGRSKKSESIDEKHKWVSSKFNTNYAVSKYRAELETWRAYHEGLPVVILNPSIVIGPGYWSQGSAKLIQQVYSGLPFYPPGSTGFVDVRDVADLVLKALESDVSGERFVCNGFNLSYREFFQRVAAALGVKAPQKKLSPLLRAFAWRYFALQAFLSRKKPVVTRESMMTSFKDFSYSNQKSRETFDFTYRSMEECLEYTCAVFMESKAAGRDYSLIDESGGNKP